MTNSCSSGLNSFDRSRSSRGKKLKTDLVKTGSPLKKIHQTAGFIQG